ncbi:hypothetical protein GRS48_04915 [Halorubrum sp. JWXQ-INN 858]|uniref:DUF7546 family protein n=1 Tax=Halorubrum sp. JWXQ-INN 858 TaxID=2690782 RepID=UPI00135B186F|nr:hypothetical protein [Halorubrum sp. JWXQ-INN 858]MWV64164.1 hypothetical protein [Halorubrum sp. JWXQ-INN 858]
MTAGPGLAGAGHALREALPGTRTLAWVALLGNAQIVAVIAYYAFLGSFPSTLRYVAYGLIWVNVSVLVLFRASIPEGYGFATRRRALAIAAGYFAVLLFFAGLVATGVPERAVDARVAWLPPGWGPAFVYAGEYLTVIVMPAYLLGYLALAKLVYVAVLEASGSLVAGVVGLFSCISCTLPIVAMIASALFGGTGILAATALDASYDLSTAVFLLTVALLYWRPDFR